ncbi:MAG TPA: hypothetical protein DEP61_07490, partial [Lachnospiraceae bacterium]|nr:hypothetical protein [Lachnospiraceae bacterium]
MNRQMLCLQRIGRMQTAGIAPERLPEEKEYKGKTGADAHMPGESENGRDSGRHTKGPLSNEIFKYTFLVSLIIVLISMGMTVVYLFRFFENETLDNLQEEASILSAGVETNGVGYLNHVDSTSRITLIDADGTVLFDNEADVDKMENHSDRSEIEEAVQSGSGQSIRRSATLTRETIYYAKKLPDGSVIRVAQNLSSVWMLLRRLLQPAVIIFMVTIMLSLFLSMKVSKKILGPLNHLDLDEPENNQTYEELSPLLERISRQQTLIWEREHSESVRRETFRRDFTANVSHELKTPLTSISGFAEIMKDGGVPEDTVRDFSKSIYEEASRLISLVNDIIKLSRLDDEKMEYEWEIIDTYALSGEILNRLKPEADKKNVRLMLDGDHGKIRGVRQVVTEMIFNLCDNAIKYNKPGGKVLVRIATTP